MNLVTKNASAPAILLWAAALAYGQQPPQSVCNHQWVPNGQPYLGVVSNQACGQPGTQPHQTFQVEAAENYNGYAYPYQGQDTKCITYAVTFMASGECGGVSAQGQTVTCLPQNPAFSPSSVSDSATTTFEYQEFVEAGSPGYITCVYSGHNAQDDTPALSASTANCQCPCPAQSSAPAPTFPPPPYTINESIDVNSPSGWIYVPGKSSYGSSNTAVATIDNPAAGAGIPCPRRSLKGAARQTSRG